MPKQRLRRDGEKMSKKDALYSEMTEQSNRIMVSLFNTIMLSFPAISMQGKDRV